MMEVPKLTNRRIWCAFVVAVLTDGSQFLFGMVLGPLGWTFMDDTLDVVAMILTSWALGFHLLLLPTFIIKFIPVADMAPFWTACVAAVVAIRKREQRPSDPEQTPPLLGPNREEPPSNR